MRRLQISGRLVGQINLLNMATPDIAMNQAAAGNEGLMQASASHVNLKFAT